MAEVIRRRNKYTPPGEPDTYSWYQHQLNGWCERDEATVFDDHELAVKVRAYLVSLELNEPEGITLEQVEPGT